MADGEPVGEADGDEGIHQISISEVAGRIVLLWVGDAAPESDFGCSASNGCRRHLRRHLGWLMGRSLVSVSLRWFLLRQVLCMDPSLRLVGGMPVELCLHVLECLDKQALLRSTT